MTKNFWPYPHTTVLKCLNQNYQNKAVSWFLSELEFLSLEQRYIVEDRLPHMPVHRNLTFDKCRHGFYYWLLLKKQVFKCSMYLENIASTLWSQLIFIIPGNVWQCVADTWHVWQHWPPQAETDSDNGWVLVGVHTTLTIDILHQSFLIKQIVKRQNLMQ